MKQLKNMLYLQRIRLKYEWKSMLFWLLFPIICTIFVYKLLDTVQEETKVPIGLVLEEQSALVDQLVMEIEAISLLQPIQLDRQEALHLLKQHELDSVFIILNGYEKNVRENRKKMLVEAYASNRSIAYPTVAESIVSLVQQDMSRSKAAFEIKKMFTHYELEHLWNYDDIIAKSSERQREEALLTVDFAYAQTTLNKPMESPTLVQLWGIWSFFMLISTFFLFDVLIKEQRFQLQTRWLYTTQSFQQYILHKTILFACLFVVMDGLTILLFSVWKWTTMTFSLFLSVGTFRLTIMLLSIALARQFQQPFYYYIVSFVISMLFVILGGALIPLDGLVRHVAFAQFLSPVQPLLMHHMQSVWLVVALMLVALSEWRRREHCA